MEFFVDFLFLFFFFFFSLSLSLSLSNTCHHKVNQHVTLNQEAKLVGYQEPLRTSISTAGTIKRRHNNVMNYHMVDG